MCCVLPQEQLAEAGDVEMQVSHFELERLDLPTPLVTLDAARNEVPHCAARW